MGGDDARRRCDLRQPFQLYRPWETGSVGSSAAADSRDRQRGAASAFGRVRQALLGDRPGVDPARAADAGLAVAGLLFDPLGTAIGRADRLRPVVSLVCRARHRGPGVGRHHLHQKPRPAAGGRGGAAIPRCCAGPGQVKRLLSSEHFSVDGTLLEAWASLKSFQPKDGSGEPPGSGRNGERDFHGERRTNDTHASTTDPDAHLYRKGPGKEARLCFIGHALMENRNGLIVDALTTRASGHAERLAALTLIAPRTRRRPVTLGADKGYDSQDFVMELRERTVTPHVAQNQSGRRSAIDGRTTRHPGYGISQRIRKRIEEAFGWAKTVAGLRKMRHC